MSRVKTGWKLGLLHQLHGVNLKKLFLKEIKNATLMYTGMIRKWNSLTTDMEQILVAWVEVQTSHNILKTKV